MEQEVSHGPELQYHQGTGYQEQWEVARRTKIAEAAYKMIQGQRLKAAQQPAFLGCDMVCVCVFSQGGCAPPRAQSSSKHLLTHQRPNSSFSFKFQFSAVLSCPWQLTLQVPTGLDLIILTLRRCQRTWDSHTTDGERQQRMANVNCLCPTISKFCEDYQLPLLPGKTLEAHSCLQTSQSEEKEELKDIWEHEA